MRAKGARFKVGDKVAVTVGGKPFVRVDGTLLYTGKVVFASNNKFDGRRKVCVMWETGDLVVYPDRSKLIAMAPATGT